MSADSGKAFVPTKCYVTDNTSDKNYTLFDTAVGDCTNDIIGLKVNYDDTAHVWQLEHLLFLLDNEVTSTFLLTCDVLVCDMEAATDCKDAYDCLIPADETTG